MPKYQTALEEFQDEEHRHAYAEDYLNTYLAVQIKVLREQRHMTQKDLAERIGTKQTGVSRLENVNHASWKTGTLKRIARALDVRLRISFETFGTLLDEAATFSRQSLERPDFANDPTFSTNDLREPVQDQTRAIFGPNVCIANQPVSSAYPQIYRWHETWGQFPKVTDFPQGPMRMSGGGSLEALKYEAAETGQTHLEGSHTLGSIRVAVATQTNTLS